MLSQAFRPEVIQDLICAKSLPSCLTLCDPMDCSLPGSSVHGISQTRVLEGVAISFSRGSSRCRDQIAPPALAGRFFTTGATCGEGNGTPLQCSCLENPRDRGAWWAADYGVAQSRTRPKWFSSSSSSSSATWETKTDGSKFITGEWC